MDQAQTYKPYEGLERVMMLAAGKIGYHSSCLETAELCITRRVEELTAPQRLKLRKHAALELLDCEAWLAVRKGMPRDPQQPTP